VPLSINPEQTPSFRPGIVEGLVSLWKYSCYGQSGKAIQIERYQLRTSNAWGQPKVIKNTLE